MIDPAFKTANVSVISEELGNSTNQRDSNHDRRRSRIFGLTFGICFNVTLTGLCICVALLWHFSEASDGLGISNANHYILTYGPTAVLVWVVAAWRQVDYKAKASAPWHELLRGTSKASRSLILDYVSTFQAAAFWSAVKNKHFQVILTIVGFVLLKLATLGSTGLFVLDNTIIAQNISGSVNSRIVSKTFNGTNDTSLSDQSLFYATYGVLVQDMQKPFGLGDGLAYPTFAIPLGVPPEANISVDLDAFLPSFTCRVVDLEAALGLANTTEEHPEVDLAIKSPGCSLLQGAYSPYMLNPQSFRCPERQLSGFVRPVNCTSSVFDMQEGSDSHDQLLVLADIRYSQSLNVSQADQKLSQRIQASSWSTKIAAVTGAVCRMTYSMNKVTVTANVANMTDSVLIQGSTTQSTVQLEGVTNRDLTGLFSGATSAGGAMLGSRDDEGYALEYPDPILKTMAAVAGGSYESLLNASRMVDAASLFGSQLAAQVAHQYLRGNTSETTNMILVKPTKRLKVTTLSARLVFGTLSGVILINSWLVVLQQGRSGGVPEDIQNVIGLTRASGGLQLDLIASQTCTENQLRRSYATWK